MADEPGQRGALEPGSGLGIRPVGVGSRSSGFAAKASGEARRMGVLMRQWHVVGVNRLDGAELEVGPYDSLLAAREECDRINAEGHIDAWVREVKPEAREF